MINPELVGSIAPFAVGALPVIGAAIFRFRENYVKVNMKQAGHGGEGVVVEHDAEETYVGVPDGSTVHMMPTSQRFFVALDYRKREGRPGNLKVAVGTNRHDSKIVDAFTAEKPIGTLDDVGVRYLGPLPKHTLSETPLKVLFERGVK